METVQAPPKRRNIPKWLLPAIGYSISAASLIWVFSKFPYRELGDHLRTINWTWVAVAIFFELAVYFVDAWRWAVLLRPVGAPSFGCSLQAVFVGLFANDVLPARAGEIVRCFLLSYKTKVHFSLALTSDLILRIMDGIWLVVIYLLVTFEISSHVVVSRIMWGFGIGVVAISVLTLYVLFRRQHAHHFVSNKSWAARFVHLLDEIHRLGDWRNLAAAMAIGSLYWFFQILAVWALARADAFDFSMGAASFLLIVKTVGTLIPNAPANVGAYQATTYYGLRLLLVEHPNAQIFSQIMFWFLTLPLVIGGAIAILLAGLNIGELQRHAHHAHKTQRLKPARAAHPETGSDSPPR